MKADYRHWLELQKYQTGTISAQMHRAGRVEEHYSDLDEKLRGRCATVRGILVASEFDAKAKAAARMVPNLTLRKYSIQFFFSEGHI